MYYTNFLIIKTKEENTTIYIKSVTNNIFQQNREKKIAAAW